MTNLDWKWFELCMGELVGICIIGFLALHWRGKLITAERTICALQEFHVNVVRILQKAKGTSGTGPGGERKCHTDMLGGPGA
jgi:hypothetical protein